MTRTDTSRQAPQQDSPDTGTQNEPEDAQGQPDDTDKSRQDEHADHDDQGDQDGGDRGERKQRQRAQRAERERDEALDLLDSTRRQIIGNMLTQRGYKPGLLKNVATEDLVGDDGMPNAEKIESAIATTADEVGATPRLGLRPNPQQGLVGGQGHAAASWSKALRGR